MSKSVIDLEFDYKVALKRQKIDKNDVLKLREIVLKNERVPKTISLKKLVSFLNACDGIEDAAVVIGKYYSIRQEHPSIFSNRDPLSAQVQQCLSNQYYFSLPKTPAGYSVIYHSLSNPTASNYIFDEACKTFFMLIDSLLNSDGPTNGLIIVFDMQNMNMRHLFRTNVDGLRTYFRFLQEALPVKLEGMFIMNCVSYFDMVLSLIKPFMKSEILNKMMWCRGKDYEKLYEKVPKSSLPKEFGGELATIAEFHDLQKKEFALLQRYFVAEEKEASLK